MAYNYYPSGDPFADLQPDLQLQTIGQNRTLTNAGARAEVSYVKGINNLKAGVVFQHTFLTEDDSFGVVDPTANAPCLNADGSRLYESRADRSGELHRAASAESRPRIGAGIYSDSGLLRSDPNGDTAGLRRLPQYHQRLIPL